MATKTKAEGVELTVEEKLKALWDLQSILSEIDRIKTLRGELPLEVQDLEDEVAGLETRIENFKNEVTALKDSLAAKKQEIVAAKELIEKYTTQQENVRNNKEYDFLSKEIEFQNLEIELCEKRIKEFTSLSKTKSDDYDRSKKQLDDRLADLESKKAELDDIVMETKQDEERLREKAKKVESTVEPRLLTAFKRIRKGARNGLAIVYIQRDACGGCFNKIPAQRQLDVKLRKKIIVCEYCGRLLIDPELAGVE